jgi:succinate-semialdehyde dehydrogenase / glutarate-semialdehyde dehydrogenase
MTVIQGADAPTDQIHTDVPVAKCLIDAEWVVGEAPGRETASPVHGGVVSRVSYSSAAQIEAAIEAAREAQREWKKVPIETRAEICHAGIDAIVARGEEIARWVSTEMGKTISEAREEVVTHVLVPVSRAAIEDAKRFGGATRPAARAEYPRRRVHTINEPIGVAGFISPWNFPVEMLLNCVGAMMMGNTCVWKPSEWAPYGPQLTTEAFVSAGLPRGVLNLIYGGPEVGEQLVTHADVGLVAFIGSTAVGEQIARAAGVKKLLLELGGNGPLVVLEDADVDLAVDAAVRGCFYMAGQVCTASERILVHERVHDEFVAKLAARAGALSIGDPLDETTDVGPLSEKRILDKVVRHVEDARAKGAKILTGGAHDGQFFEPTVLSGVTPDMEIAREETFGPVAPVIKVTSADEALAIANDSPYGLAMSVFTSSLRSAFDMAEGLEAGTVNVNAGTNDWEVGAAFGGVKKSGIGREVGDWALREFTTVKTITFDLT